MSTPWKPPAPGALDDTPWPEQLAARVIDVGDSDDRLHGFAVLGDLAKHYHFSDMIYLALVGETPDARASALFALALAAFATPSVREAPAHVAVLAKLSGGPLASALGAGLVVAADEAQAIATAHEPLLAWCEAPSDPVPDAMRGDDAAWVATLNDAVARIDPSLASIRPEMSRDAARVALLHAAGLRRVDQIQAAIVAARVGGIAAEAMATGPEHLGQYPVKVPAYRYVED